MTNAEFDSRFYAIVFAAGIVLLVIGIIGPWKFLVAGATLCLFAGLCTISWAITYK